MQTATGNDALIQSAMGDPGFAASAIGPEQLAEAFGAFSSAAQALERSYLGLGQEVARLRRELDQERDLRRRREALAEVSALLAHEIKNPLGSVELFAGLLSNAIHAEPEKDWVMQMQAGLRLVSATVNNILEFHSSGAPALQPVELNGILCAIESFLHPLAARAGMRWLAQLTTSSLRIHGDRQRLEQVFLNLALNAFRFAAQGGILRVRSRQDEGNAVLIFEDEGPGIAPEILARLFEPGVTTRSGGTGLGLAVAKRIVEQHGGAISVASAAGLGTVFHLRFPLVAAAEGSAFANLPENAKAMGATA